LADLLIDLFDLLGICSDARCSWSGNLCGASMDQDDYQFLRDIAAECRERAGRARDDRDRTLWLELAEEIASRDPGWSKASSVRPN
jgi:hypothetical protein